MRFLLESALKSEALVVFSLHFRPPRVGRNPKTGETVSLPGKYVPHFKPGKELRERVNKDLDKEGNS